VMAEIAARYDVNKLAVQHLTVKVELTGIRRWRVKLWIARQLFNLAAFILRCEVKIDFDSKPTHGHP
jgi:hypothetical protein